MAQWKLQVFHPKSNGLTALQTWHRKANGPTALKTSSWIVRWRPLGILSRTGGTGRDGIPPVFMEHRGGEHRKPSCARFIQYPEMSLIERALEIDNEKHFLSYTLDENDVLGGIKGFVGYAEFRDTGDGKTFVPYWIYEVEPVENQTPETFYTFGETVMKALLVLLETGAQRLSAGLYPLPANQSPNTPADSITISH